MGELLPAGRHEVPSSENRRMDEKTDTRSDMEAMETGENPIQNAEKTARGGMENPGDSEL